MPSFWVMQLYVEMDSHRRHRWRDRGNSRCYRRVVHSMAKPLTALLLAGGVSAAPNLRSWRGPLNVQF